MRSAMSLTCLLAMAGCSSGYPGPATNAGTTVKTPAANAAPPTANFPNAAGDEADEWEEFFRDTRVRRTLDFSGTDEDRNRRTASRLEESDSLDTSRRRSAEGSGYVPSYSGGNHMSYDPELRRMGLKVGRDGKLHEVGGDARSANDPDGPAVEWDELHRRQFGH